MGLVFFLTEHNIRFSLAEAYTQSADEMELTAAGGNLLRRVALPGLAALGLVLLVTARQPLHVHWWLAAPMAAYFIVAAASCLWSVDFPLCVRRLIVLACATVGAAGIARRFSMRELCQFTLMVAGSLVVVGLLAELVLGTFRPWSADHRFAGTVHPNTQGAYCTLLALAALGLLGHRRGWPIGLYVLITASVVLVLLTKSRTGTAASLLALAAVMAVKMPLSKQLVAALAAAWAVAGCGWLLMALGFDPLADLSTALLLGRTEQADTLSGRAFIWPLVIDYVRLRPWLGYGYEAFWNPTHIQSLSADLGWGIREAHSGYLDVLLSMGLVGLALGLAAAATGLFVAVCRTRRSAAYALPLGLIVFGLVASSMESGMVTVMLPSWLAGCCFLRMSLFEQLPTHR